MAEYKNIGIVDRMVERIKSSQLGDLIQEEDLYDIMKEAIPKAFFAEVPDPKDTSSYNRRMLPPLIVSAMREKLVEQARPLVDKWVQDNQDVMLEYWKKVCDDGLIEVVQKIQDQRVAEQIKMVLRPMIDSYNQAAQREGRSMIYL